jgi:hypothetical protein
MSFLELADLHPAQKKQMRETHLKRLNKIFAISEIGAAKNLKND